MNNNNLSAKPHYPILDGLRGVAAIIVVTFHLTEPLGTALKNISISCYFQLHSGSSHKLVDQGLNFKFWV
ncbi:peptidoglycan/LPS O-acetylase OafA/YrhL [Pedobacter sp. UYP1]